MSPTLNSGLSKPGTSATGFRKQDLPALKNQTSIGTLIGQKKTLSGIHVKGKLAGPVKAGLAQKE